MPPGLPGRHFELLQNLCSTSFHYPRPVIVRFFSALTADGAVAGEIPSQPAVVGRSRPRDGGDKMLNDSAKRRDRLFDLTPGSWGTRTWGTSARNWGCSIGAVPDNRIWRTRGWPAAWPEVPGRAASSGAAPPGCVRSTLPTLRKYELLLTWISTMVSNINTAPPEIGWGDFFLKA